MTGRLVGLTAHEVAERRSRFGENTLPRQRPRGLARIVAAQFGQLMVVVLIIAAIVAALARETADLVSIGLIVILNATLGAAQDYRAERALESLRRIAAPRARVRRDGIVADIPASELVPDDVVLLEAGNNVPADLRLLDAFDLRISEALITGESAPVQKRANKSAETVTPDEAALAFQGTIVTHGRGVGIVIATGARTRLGAIATLLRDQTPPRTPLQRRLDRLGRQLAVIAGFLGLLILVVVLIRRAPLVIALMTALSMTVAAIPEALPAVVTMTLALGARRLAQRHALVRRLPAVETLGSVAFICTDKTGTLTENRMRVDWPSGVAPDRSLLEALAVSNDALVSPNGAMTGDPTEVALCTFAAESGHAKFNLEQQLPRVAELGFTHDRARMTTIHRRADGGIVAFTKGAPESVLSLCKGSDARSRGLLSTADGMAGQGQRVLAVARREMVELPPNLVDVERDMEFLGLVGLLDPPREDAASAVETCRAAGVSVAMVTGDHLATALAIARRIGIPADDTMALTGVELRALSDSELAERVDRVRVYARTTPEDKLRIVRALQARGQVVAMTGDGVNDAPALQRADIGVAMGRSGTDVARDAASMVLLDDNFATIVEAIAEGRRVYDNMRKFVRYILGGNTGEVIAVLVAPALGLPVPLLPIQILWVNLVTDGLPGLALAMEPAEPNVMRRPPRPPTEGVLAAGLWQSVLRTGFLIGGLTLAVQWVAIREHWHWQSMTFATLTFAQTAQVLTMRSERRPLLGTDLWSNPSLLAAVAITIALQCALLYMPVLQSLVRTQALGAAEMGVVCAAAVIVGVVGEVEKRLRVPRDSV